MMRISCWARFAVLCIACFVLAGHVHAQVKDDAEFFSPAAVSQANAAAGDIKLSYQKDFKVETFRTVPADKLAKFKTLDDAGRRKFFGDWARFRAKTLDIHGVYVHACKQPGHLEVIVDNGTLKKALTTADRDEISKLVLDAFRNKDFDRGLTGAAALARARLEKNLGPPAKTPSPAGAVVKGIVDQGQFFSAEAVNKAAAEIKDFQKRLGKDVLIETFAMPPPDIRAQLEGKDAAGRSKVFAEWMGQRAAANRIDGVRVLICKEPPHIRAGASETVLTKAFTAANREELGRILVAGFKEKKYDQALATAVDFIYDTVDRNTTAPIPPPVLGAVVDQAHVFGPAVLAKVDAIKDIKAKFDYDVSIETFTRVPPGKLRQVSAVTPEVRTQFFRDWAKERAQDAGARGAWVLICKQPAYIQISIGAAKKDQVNAADRDGMREILAAGLRDKQPDAALVRSLAFLDETLRALPVKDEAGYFNGDTIAEANQRIKGVRRKYRKDLLIETVASLPADKKDAYAKLAPEDAKARDQFFVDWQTERAQRARGDIKVDGVEVLICKDPPRIQIGVTAGTSKQFGPPDRDALRDMLVAKFKEKAADKGLLESVAFVGDTLLALGIKDEGGFFTPTAVDKGNAAIRDIRRRYHKDVLIETFGAVPAERANGVDLSNKAERRKLFAAWAEERQKAAGMDGISVLICKSPMSLQVATGPATGARFPTADRDKLVQLLIARFNEKNFDGGLADALTLIGDTLNKHRVVEVKGGGKSEHTFADLGSAQKKKTPPVIAETKSAPPPTIAQTKTAPPTDTSKPTAVAVSKPPLFNTEVGGFNMMYLVWGVVALLGLWIFIGILRSLFGRRPSYPPPQPQQPMYSGGRPVSGAPGPHYNSGVPVARPVAQAPGYYGPGQAPYYGQPAPSGGGGGSFLHGVLGGMLGAAAGSWLYSRFAGGSGSVNAGWSGSTSHPYPVAGPAPASPATPAAGTGYSSSGGDFGDQAQEAPKYASSGGDFGEAQPAADRGYTSSGGDFGAAPEAQQASSGGDFGDTAASEPAGSGGDFGEQQAAADSSGGDFASEQAQPVSESGGDFGGGNAGADTRGGGDFGGENVDTGGGGGDFGGGADTGGGGGGDFGGGGGDAGGGGGGDVAGGGGGDFGGGSVDAGGGGGDFG